MASAADALQMAPRKVGAGENDYQPVRDEVPRRTKSLPWSTRRVTIVVAGVLMALAGLAFTITDFALPTVAWPYHGYNVTSTTSFLYYGLQFSQWNIAIPLHVTMTVFGIFLALLALPALYTEIYERSKMYGVDSYLAGIMVFALVAYAFFFALVCNMQDLMVFLAVALGFQLAQLFFYFLFYEGMGQRLKALRDADAGVGSAEDAAAKTPAIWTAFFFALTMWIMQCVYFATYGITSMQYYQSVTSAVTGSARWWVILANLLVWFLATLVILVLTAVRYMAIAGGAYARLRRSSVYDVAIIIVIFIALALLGISLLVGGVVGQPTY